MIHCESSWKGLYKTQVGETMKLASPSKRKDPGGADNSSCGRCSGSNGEGLGLECSIDLICSAGNTICACKRTKVRKFSLKCIVTFPPGSTELGKLMTRPDKRRKLTRSVPLARITPSQS